ncbi:MAG: hypothetical protein N2Z76_03580 [Treponemataceae bacterium]|nr:hypothetical protein [Treponemataceae bacterium]
MNDITRLIIISVPPEPLRTCLEELRQELCLVGKSFEALRYPVHLTLRTGILLPEQERHAFFEEFSSFIKTHVMPFTIRLDSFVTEVWPTGDHQGAGSCFAGFKVEHSPDLMEAHRKLASFDRYRKGPQYPYYPHVTMAFDDLDAKGLESIRSLIADNGKENENRHSDTTLATKIASLYGASWTCYSIELYRREGEKWVVDTVIPLRPTY